MSKTQGWLYAACIAALAALGYAAYAAQAPSIDEPGGPGSADLPTPAGKRMQALRAAGAKDGGALGAAAVTVDDVGDVDSFERNVRWLGLTQMNITLADDCSGTPSEPGFRCQALAPAPAFTAFDFEDVAYIRLPPKASHSLLCYWLSPVLVVNYANPTAAPVVARLSYFPTLTVENSLLDDPALIDASTGLPFGGRLLTSMTASERFEVPLPAGLTINERTRDSAVCIAGFLSRRALVDNYGLTPSQAKEFFKRETTVRMNISGNAQYVGNAQLIFGLRIVGD